MSDASERADVQRLPLGPRGSTEAEQLLAAVRRLSLAQSIEEVMATATLAARALLHAGGVTFVLRDGDLCYYAEEDAVSPLWKGKRFPIEACISGWCMTNKRTAAIPDVYEDGRIPQDAYRPTFVRSLAMAPVRKEDPIAAMGAYWAETRDVQPKEMELLQALADASALAISNVTLRRKETEAGLLQAESAHRVKNVLSMAIAFASQTEGTTVGEFRRALTSRLRALELAQSQLFASEAGEVDAFHFIESLLWPYTRSNEEQLSLAVPADLLLSAPDATHLGLLITELGMNASKYGAWSVATGRVAISCRRVHEAIELDWQELDGPPVTPPARQGFGTKFLRATEQKSGGKVDIVYHPSGLQCRIRLPLPTR